MERIARRLQDELLRVKQQLHDTIEQHEVQQEKLQSLNEELSTVNQELRIKIEELSQANNDTQNLMNSTDLALVFIDRDMCIKLFTPRARSIFSLMPADTGRSLLDITHRLRYPQMVDDVERVLDTLASAEREVEGVDGSWYIARVLPYRTAEDRISGVVLTFTNITERKQSEMQLRESEERLRMVVESVPEFAIFTLNNEGVIETWNTAARSMFGYSHQEAIGQHVRLIFTAEDRAAGIPEREIATARETGRASDDRWHARKDGSTLFLTGVMAPLMSKGVRIGYTKMARDLTHRQRTEDDLHRTREELEQRVRERTQELAHANGALRREMEERMQSEEMRVRLLRQMVSIEEEERRRISRELHDQLGQEVTVLGLKLASIKRAPELSEATRSQIAALETIVKEVDGDVDFLVWELRPTGLDDLGLHDALTDYAQRWSHHFDLPIEISASLGERLDPEIEIVLYRIVQEALTNVAKHARAAHVRLSLGSIDGRVVLDIADDGVGFDPGAPHEGNALGLLSMRERAALVGGEVTVASRPGGGTRIGVSVLLGATSHDRP